MFDACSGIVSYKRIVFVWWSRHYIMFPAGN